MKIVHFSDLHIKNTKYHEEYRYIFNNFYKELKKEKPDIILFSGDLGHTKTQISPEYVQLCSELLYNLAEIGPLYLICGNHDSNLKNLNRMDCITPVVNALNHSNIHYTRDSIVYTLNEHIDLYVWSIFDKSNWKFPQNKNKINICAYHGPVEGSKTDMNYTLTECGMKTSDFKDFDYVMLGDIHKSNQIMDNEGRIRYAGSTIQQNFGESNDKGFLIWNINGKHGFDVQHVVLEHPKPFINLQINSQGMITNVPSNIPKGSRIRIVSKEMVPLDYVKTAQKAIETKYEPEFITYSNQSNKLFERKEIQHSKVENLRDIEVQNKIFKEYAQYQNCDEQTIQKILEINQQYNTTLTNQEEALRNVDWEIIEMKWSNLFNYGLDNNINFQSLNGIVGVFGKNFSGKSSIFDTLLFGLFNSDSKDSRKNVHLINENKQYGLVELKFRIGNEIFKIYRKLTKFNKKVDGDNQEEAKVELIFEVTDIHGNTKEENKDSRSMTDTEIQRYIGTLENFMLSSMSGQDDSFRFLKERSTRRKEIISKFLDLDFFDLKYKLAKDEKKYLELKLKQYENKNFNSLKLGFKGKLARNEQKIIEQKKECSKISNEIQKQKQELSEIKKLLTIDKKYHSEEEISKNLNELSNKLEASKGKLKTHKKTKLELQNLYKKIDESISLIDDINLNEQKKNIQEKKKRLLKLSNEIQQTTLKQSIILKKTKLLDEVPCGDEYTHCKFIKDAWKEKENIKLVEICLKNLQNKKEQLEEDKYNISEKEIDEKLNELRTLEKQSLKLKSDVHKIDLEINKLSSNIQNYEHEYEHWVVIEKEHKEYKHIFDNFELNQQKYDDLLKQIKTNEHIFNKCEVEYLNLIREEGILKEKLDNTEHEEKIYLKLLKEYTAYDVYSNACHPNGIPYNIIKQKLPLINQEISKILNGVVDFEIFIESENKKLNIYIQHPKYNKRPIEGSSGAEKTFAAISIRLALLNISSLPKSNIFILDEPGKALDEENLDGFIRILDMIKNNFQIVFLISHMDVLKDVADSIMEIEKNNGYAKINI